MEQSILRSFLEKGFLLDRELVDFFMELNDEELALDIINKISIASKRKIITKNLVEENFDKIKIILSYLDDDKKNLFEKFFSDFFASGNKKPELLIKKDSVNEIDGEYRSKNNNPVKIISSPVIPSKKLEVKDFVRYFRVRYNTLKTMLQQKSGLENLISIDKINNYSRNFSIIGMITNKSTTKNKNIILEVEDLTGKIKLLINHAKENVFEKSKEILLDDVVGFNVSGSRDFLYVNDIFYPDCYINEKKKTEEEVYALFISDIHVGSKNFLEKNFTQFINWLNGDGSNKKQEEVIKKIKYLFVVGDTIDGVGVYPGQEKDLLIKDIREQYKKLAEFYKKIPKHINIIQCAGQHDAVRVAEPQPPVDENFAPDLHTINNLYLVSNPSLIEIESEKGKEGIKVLMYHGASMHGVINEIEELRVKNAASTPAKVVRHLLLRRHLAPSHGQIIYIPSSNIDPLAIKEIPDIITTGDLHRTDIDNYNGVLIISNSCWQSMTAFEEKVGNKPDPCKVPILNLKTREIKILDFSGEGGNGDRS